MTSLSFRSRFGLGLALLAPNFACGCPQPPPEVETCGDAPGAMPTNVTLYRFGSVVENESAISSTIGGQGSPMVVFQVGLDGVTQGSCAAVSVFVSGAIYSSWSGRVRSDLTEGALRTRDIFLPFSNSPQPGQAVDVSVTANGRSRDFRLYVDTVPVDASVQDVGVPDANRNDANRIDGSAIDGSAIDGAALDGAALDGAALDGAAIDGAALDGAALDGAAVESDAAGTDAT